MKVRHIRARRYEKAIPVVLKQYGPKCPSFDAGCIVCQGSKMLRIHKRIPHFAEAFKRTQPDETYTDWRQRGRDLEDFDMHTKGE